MRPSGRRPGPAGAGADPPARPPKLTARPRRGRPRPHPLPPGRSPCPPPGRKPPRSRPGPWPPATAARAPTPPRLPPRRPRSRRRGRRAPPTPRAALRAPAPAAAVGPRPRPGSRAARPSRPRTRPRAATPAGPPAPSRPAPGPRPPGPSAPPRSGSRARWSAGRAVSAAGPARPPVPRPLRLPAPRPLRLPAPRPLRLPAPRPLRPPVPRPPRPPPPARTRRRRPRAEAGAGVASPPVPRARRPPPPLSPSPRPRAPPRRSSAPPGWRPRGLAAHGRGRRPTVAAGAAAAGSPRTRSACCARARSARCWSPRAPSGPRSASSRAAPWSSTTSPARPAARWSATSTSAGSRTSCPAWRPPSSTSARAATRCCTPARSTTTRRTSTARLPASRRRSSLGRRSWSRSPRTRSAPKEPELVVRVIRDIFSPDFIELVVDAPGLYERVKTYLEEVAPDLLPKVKAHDGRLALFEQYRVTEQIHKALERKVWLPSGGSLVIDQTEAMTVVDVNTGKYVGKSNLEETVVATNLEAADEIVRQLRLRDIGGIIIIDFIDMLFEKNQHAVVERLRSALARDKTKSQVMEVSSLGLVQMTRKRVSGGLLDSFSETCPACEGRGVVITHDV